MLVEVNRKSYLASLVPVIVNAILMEHQIIVDIVAFVNKGDFPRSRLGEKQRGKLLAGWVTRKMRTIAQFAIRDVDPGALGETASGGEGTPTMVRNSMLSAHSSGGAAGASSLRNVEQTPKIMEHEEFQQQMDRIGGMPQTEEPMQIPDDQQNTPRGYLATAENPEVPAISSHTEDQRGRDSYELPSYEQFGTTSGPPPVGAKPARVTSGEGQAPPQIRLPGVDGRENVDFWSGSGKDDDDSWEADAIMHMNLTGDMGDRR